MNEQYSILIALRENLPDSYSDDHLHVLEQLVTRYRQILNHIAGTDDPDNHTLYYRERIQGLEAELKDAKYGHTEKQRTASFRNATEMTSEAITALLYHLNERHRHL